MSLLQTPDNWNSELLENLLVHIIGGDWGKAPDHQEKDYQAVACIRGSEFRNWSNESGRTAVLRKVKASSLDKRSLLPGDILLEISGGGPDQPVGRTVLIDQAVLDQFHTPVIGTNFLRLLRPSAALDQRFLNKYLELFYSSGEVVKYQGGSNNLRNLKFKEYSQISVPVPPLAEQKVIADKLDTLLAQVETTKARLERVPQILKRFRQSVLAAAVSGRLTEEWRDLNSVSITDWVALTVGDVATVATGKTPSRKEPKYWEDGDVPWLTSASTGAIYTDSAEQFVTKRAVDECSLKVFPPGTLLLAMYGEGKTRGQVTELRLSATCNQACAAVTADEQKILRSYLKLRLLENYEETRKAAAGGAQPNLNLNKVRAISISVPDKEEQTEIVRRVDQLFAHADRIEQQVNNALARVNNLTQSILAKAFRGELTEQWRKDNPELISGENSAEALLERIKAERATVASKSRRRKAKA
ncbi:restriction endonuclease subunit S [Marinobacter sp. LQ44]|uniref:restriction endonuclease subunit S n=1 Tax=unclassified Marinobacter TaxID=83889 RepID=UPI000718CD91|nr:restriction endonuclease subunit S [Marinobacter sp. LQ44]AMQ89119.1 hypothetical protein ASQ50_10670 [Marinobacter sp. LQ44]